MRCALAVVLSLTGAVHADVTFAHTQEVVGRHASRARKIRIGTGVAMVASGVALGAGGVYMVANVKEGGLIDLSALEKGFGYTVVGIGGVLVLASPLLLFKRSQAEQLRDDISDERDAQLARAQIAHNANDTYRSRVIVRGLGVVVAGVGALSVTVGAAAGEAIEEDARKDLVAMGITMGVLGSGLVLASLIDYRWETIHRELTAPSLQMSAGIVPTRGGAIAGVTGTF
jgi:hypothetical protein